MLLLFHEGWLREDWTREEQLYVWCWLGWRWNLLLCFNSVSSRRQLWRECPLWTVCPWPGHYSITLLSVCTIKLCHASKPWPFIWWPHSCSLFMPLQVVRRSHQVWSSTAFHSDVTTVFERVSILQFPITLKVILVFAYRFYFYSIVTCLQWKRSSVPITYYCSFRHVAESHEFSFPRCILRHSNFEALDMKK